MTYGMGRWLTAVWAAGTLVQAAFAQTLRDDGTYQNGGDWATPLPWLMETVMRDDPARAARYFCDAVEDFRSRKDINEWVNDLAAKPRGVRDYCASAAMPLAGARRLRAFLAESGKTLQPDLARRLDADEAWLKREALRVLRGSSRLGKGGVRIFTPEHYMGAVTGDLTHKRGRVLGYEAEDDVQVILADVPQAEIFRYAAELRSITGGQATFEMKFSRYDVVPSSVAPKVIADSPYQHHNTEE